jgi:hypothetical protein
MDFSKKITCGSTNQVESRDLETQIHLRQSMRFIFRFPAFFKDPMFFCGILFFIHFAKA